MSATLIYKGKTEQRVAEVISVLKGTTEPLYYADLKDRCSCPYDALLYILHTLTEIGMVQRVEIASGPGRPKVQFVWIHGKGAQDGGS